METKETELQQKDCYIQQLGMKLKEKDLEIHRQQKELQTVMVGSCINVWLLSAIVFFRLVEGNCCGIANHASQLNSARATRNTALAII